MSAASLPGSRGIQRDAAQGDTGRDWVSRPALTPQRRTTQKVPGDSEGFGSSALRGTLGGFPG